MEAVKMEAGGTNLHTVKMEEAGGSAIIAQKIDYKYQVGDTASKSWKLTTLVVYLDLHSKIQGFIQSLTNAYDFELRSKIQGLMMETESKIHEICLKLRTEEAVMLNSLEDLQAICYLKKYYNWMGISLVPEGDFMFVRNAAEERHVLYCVWKIAHIKMEPVDNQKFGNDVGVAAFIKAKVTSLVNYLGLMSSIQSLLQSSTGYKIQLLGNEIQSKIDEICLRLCKEEGVMVNSVEDLDAVCYLKKKYDWKGKAIVLDNNGNGFVDNHSMVLRNAAVGKNVSYFVCRKFN